jgi:hypothetical protein
MTERAPGSTRDRRFLRGLRSSSPLVLIAAVALVFPVLLGLQALFTSGSFAVFPEGLLLRKARDDFLHNTYTVGRLKLHPPDRLPVYVIGGSAARESLISDHSFADQIHRATGVPVRVYVLSNYDQSLGETLAIVDNLPRGRGIVVIAVNNNRFHFSPARMARQTRGVPLLLDSPTLRAFVAQHPPPSMRPARLPGVLPGIMDYLVGWFDLHASALAKGRPFVPTYDPHWITERKVWSRAQKERGVERWRANRGKAFFENYRYNATLLDRLVARAKERGFMPVLLEETENTAIVGHQFDDYKRIYKPIVRSIADKYGVPYLDLQSRLSLPDSAFWDFIHPVEPARVIWQRVLAKALRPVVREAGPVSSPSGPAGGGAVGSG